MHRGDSVQLNLDFVHCYQCYRQPFGKNRHLFIVLTCQHTYCDTCKDLCAGVQAPDLMFCFVCRKPVKYEPISLKDAAIAFQNRIESSLFEQLHSGVVERLDKVDGEQKQIAKQWDMNCSQFDGKMSKMKRKSSRQMSRERYTNLLCLADGKLNQMKNSEPARR